MVGDFFLGVEIVWRVGGRLVVGISVRVCGLVYLLLFEVSSKSMDAL